MVRSQVHNQFVSFQQVTVNQLPHLLSGVKMLIWPPSSGESRGKCDLKIILQRAMCHAYCKGVFFDGKKVGSGKHFLNPTKFWNSLSAHHSSCIRPQHGERQEPLYAWGSVHLALPVVIVHGSAGALGRYGCFHPGDPVDLRPAHLLHLTLASSALN